MIKMGGETEQTNMKEDNPWRPLPINLEMLKKYNSKQVKVMSLTMFIFLFNHCCRVTKINLDYLNGIFIVTDILLSK